MSQLNLHQMRTEYERNGLSEQDAGFDPFALFQRWFDQALASGIAEPNAFTLATSTPQGHPSARVVLLKKLDHRGFTFFTNYNSRKASEISANPNVAMVFLWKELERQVRVEGQIEKVTAQESDDYYRNRPMGSRLGAWASPQSQIIPDRETLETEQAALIQRFHGIDPPRPDHWGGYRILPSLIEFWQGRPSRLHDRIQFVQGDGTWIRRRLAH